MTSIFRYSQCALFKAILSSNSLQVTRETHATRRWSTSFSESGTAQAECQSGSLGETESSNMGDETATLAIKIQTTEEKIEKLERHVVNNDFAGTPYDDRAEAKAALKALTAEKAALQNKEVELLKKENLLLQQQQQSAGTSMLRVRLALVIFLPQRSCCMLANLVACRVCLGLCWLCCSA
jgi:hypothetical protein